MSIFSWVRDVFGIRKDYLEKKKIKLEIEDRLNERERIEKLIQPATLEEVKEYDPKVKRIRAQIQMMSRKEMKRRFPLVSTLIILIVFIVMLLIFFLYIRPRV